MSSETSDSNAVTVGASRASGLSATPPEARLAQPEHGVFANRTLDLSTVKTIGYDMDYTLIYYRVEEWEGAAFEHAKTLLARGGWNLDKLRFDPTRFTIGLTFDVQLGNLLKVTRFGYVVRAQHGDRMLSNSELREAYRETVVELDSPRFEFMNTLFELSRASLWTQLVEQYDRQALPGVRSYADLYGGIDKALSTTHLSGPLKGDILADPDRFVELDPLVVPTLLDQRGAGKQLVLITNSEWEYTQHLMSYSLDRFCPNGQTWRDLFDIVIVSSKKPRFFSETDPVYRVVDEERTLLAPHTGLLEAGGVFFGGNARLIEASLQHSDSSPLYVGDHLFGDVHISKAVLRWRTALVVRELEAEVLDAKAFAGKRAELDGCIDARIALDRERARLQMETLGTGPGPDIVGHLEALGEQTDRLEKQITKLANEANQVGNPIWGPLMRSGADKSLFARQVEKYADIYTSRVSNLGSETPFAYLRATPGTLPHDSASR